MAYYLIHPLVKKNTLFKSHKGQFYFQHDSSILSLGGDGACKPKYSTCCAKTTRSGDDKVSFVESWHCFDLFHYVFFTGQILAATGIDTKWPLPTQKSLQSCKTLNRFQVRRTGTWTKPWGYRHVNEWWGSYFRAIWWIQRITAACSSCRLVLVRWRPVDLSHPSPWRLSSSCRAYSSRLCCGTRGYHWTGCGKQNKKSKTRLSSTPTTNSNKCNEHSNKR